MPVELDVDKWAEENFGACDLGDVRRTKRAVKLAAQIAAHPDGSTPTQTEAWGDCKAAYRLFDQEDVSFDMLCQPHWRRTRARGAGTWLLIGDTTEIEFGIQREVAGLAPTGDGGGRGFFLHSSLMIDSQTEEIVGIAGAELFHRKLAPEHETLRQKKKRTRESEVWGRVIDLVGSPPEAAKFVHILDAGADNYEVFCHLQTQKCGWIVRAAQKDRFVLDADNHRHKLQSYVQQQPLLGAYELSLRSRDNRPARTAMIEVRAAHVRMPVPVQATPYMKQSGIRSIAMCLVEVREVDPPVELEEPLYWILLTSEPVETFEDAWTIIGWYEKRPTIEDYHKCLKTGCRVENRQYKTSARLERMVGMMTVVAARLLQLKFVARTDPNRPAERLVPRAWLRMLQAVRKGRPINTVGEFFRSLAMFGGFLGRKGDGQPGWITIWRGMDKLLLCLRGADAMGRKCG